MADTKPTDGKPQAGARKLQIMEGNMRALVDYSTRMFAGREIAEQIRRLPGTKPEQVKLAKEKVREISERAMAFAKDMEEAAGRHKLAELFVVGVHVSALDDAIAAATFLANEGAYTLDVERRNSLVFLALVAKDQEGNMSYPVVIGANWILHYPGRSGYAVSRYEDGRVFDGIFSLLGFTDGQEIRFPTPEEPVAFAGGRPIFPSMIEVMRGTGQR